MENYQGMDGDIVSVTALGKAAVPAKSELAENLLAGLQHVLTMCPGAIAVPMILGNGMGLDHQTIAFLIAANFFAAALATLLQVVGVGKFVGSKLPIALGSAFAPLGPMIIIGQAHGLPAVFGGVIASGAILFVVCMGINRILKFFPPIVLGAFLTMVGVTLIPTAFENLAGGAGAVNFGSPINLVLGFGVLLLIVLLNQFGNTLLRSTALLIGLGTGTLLAIPFGLVDLSPVAGAALFDFNLPFHFGMPEFRLDAILIMTLFSVINMVQCIGVFAFLDNVRGTTTDEATITRGMRAQSLSQMMAGVFNSFPSAMFNENVSVVKLSGNDSRQSVAFAAVLLLILSLCPKLSTFITCIPTPVIGGAMVALFGTIAAAGVSILAKVDLSDNKSTLILGAGLAAGVGAHFTTGAFSGLPEVVAMLFSNGLFMVALVTVVLNVVFNWKTFWEGEESPAPCKGVEGQLAE